MAKRNQPQEPTMNTQEKLTQLETLEKQYHTQKEKYNKILHQKYLQPLKQFQQQIVNEGCFHPRTQTTTQENDNGYGKWWKTETTTCTLCGKIIETKYT